MRYINYRMSREWERWAGYLGIDRLIENRRKGLQDRAGFDSEVSHYLGACYEVAGAHLWNVCVSYLINTLWGEADLPGNWEIRGTQSDRWPLKVRPTDKDHFKCVRVTGPPSNMRFHGWYSAGEAKKHPEWFQEENKSKRVFGGFYVPNTELLPLPDDLAVGCVVPPPDFTMLLK